MKLLQHQQLENNDESQSPPPHELKSLFRDAAIVFGASIGSAYLFFNVDMNVTDIMHILTETKTAPAQGASEIFVGNPEF